MTMPRSTADAARSKRWTRSRFAAVALVWIATFLLVAQTAGAEKLKNFVNDLYGGDGITLGSNLRNQPPGENFSSFQETSIGSLGGISSQLLSTLDVVSLSSAPPGFTFDFELGVPVKEDRSFGPLIAERAETLGKNKLDISFSYTRIVFKRLDGEKISNLTIFAPSGDVLPPGGDGVIGPDPPCDPDDPLACTSPAVIELDQLRIDLDVEIERDIFALFAKYGLLENLDVEIVVPFIETRVRARARASIVRNEFNEGLSELFNQFGEDLPDPSDCANCDPKTSSSGGSASGIGDVLIRSKYNFLRDSELWPDLAIRVQLQLPTGNEDKLLGTGETSGALTFIASKPLGRLTPHLNLGYEMSTGPSELDALRYISGFDMIVHPRLTIALDAIGVYEPNQEEIGNHLVDLAFGVRAKVWRSLILNSNIQVPMNRDEGLRPDFIWSVGFDYTFGDE